MISCKAACLPKGPPIGFGWVMQGWVYHTGVGWVMQGWVGHTGVGWVIKGWGGSCRGGVGMQGWGVVGHVEVKWVMQFM